MFKKIILLVVILNLFLIGFSQDFTIAFEENNSSNLDVECVGTQGITANITVPPQGFDDLSSLYIMWFVNGDNVDEGTGMTSFTLPYTYTYEDFNIRAVISSSPFKYSNYINGTINEQSTPGTLPNYLSYCKNQENININFETLPEFYPAGSVSIPTFKVLKSYNKTDWNVIYEEQCFPNQLRINVDTPSDGETFYIKVKYTDGCRINHSTNTLTLISYPDISPGSIGSSQNLCFGQNAEIINSLESPSGGDGNFDFYWEYTVDGVTTTLENNKEYYLPVEHLDFSNGAEIEYKRIAVNRCGSASSNSVLIKVADKISSGVIGEDQTICNGDSPVRIDNISSPSGGVGDWSFSWQKRSVGGSWNDIDGSSNFLDLDEELFSPLYFRRVETNSCGVEYSNAVFIDVLDAFNPGTIGNSVTICHNSNSYSFSTINPASGYINDIEYRWFISEHEDGPFSIAPDNYTSENYSPNSFNPGVYFFKRKAISDCGEGFSNTITLTILPELVPPTIGYSQTIDFNTIPNSIETLYDASGGDGVYNFQWQSKVNSSSSWQDILDASDLNYSPDALTDTTHYRLRVSDAVCSDTFSNIVTINVRPDLVPGEIGEDHFICFNEEPNPITETVEPDGGTGSYSFAWESRFSGGEWFSITDVDAPNLSDVPLPESAYFRRKVSSGSISKYTNVVFIEKGMVLDAPSVDGAGTFCVGDVVNLSASADRAQNFYWTIGSANDTIFNDAFSVDGISDSFDFSVWYSDELGCFSPKVDSAVLVDDIQASFSQSHDVISVGDKVDFECTSENAVEYVWNFGFGDLHYTANPSIYYNNSGVFDVDLTVFSERGCESSVFSGGAVSVGDATNVNSNNYHTFAVYPNPSNGVFFLDANNILVDRVVLYDAMGKRIVDKKIVDDITKFDIDYNGFVLGVLFLDNVKVGNFKMIAK